MLFPQEKKSTVFQEENVDAAPHTLGRSQRKTFAGVVKIEFLETDARSVAAFAAKNNVLRGGLCSRLSLQIDL